MPDSAPPADGAALTSSWLQTMVREQVIRTVTSSTRPTGVEGAVIFETDTDQFLYYTGSAWAAFAGGASGVILTDAAQTIATSTITDITWGTEVSDIGGWTSGGSATLTVPTALGGRYAISYTGTWSASPGTASAAALLINGTVIAYEYEDVGAFVVFASKVGLPVYKLAAADTIKIQVFQNSGGNVNMVSRLEICYLGA